VNHELEAFTYSVSHDLRAPLRSIDGYAKILEEDYASKLDEEGNRVMKVIMNNAKKMGNLIDDLLEFSRLGRKDVSKTECDVDSIERNILNDQMDNESRQIDLTVDELLPCRADLPMIRQVWINLISNALKYTRKTPNPKIGIRSYVERGNTIYAISDNGVGFDMKYIGKLFGVFQRLHKQQDFEGTGVGLAIVYRIISRHGGKVWAEGAVNEGATFFFSLPGKGSVSANHDKAHNSTNNGNSGEVNGNEVNNMKIKTVQINS
jgi:light-regulated signal transduction histidine kinase (bacteriophytochrome)